MSVEDHYRNLLAECYGWSLGGLDTAVVRNSALLRSLGFGEVAAGRALDLGAGNGAQSIPLASLGYQVTAVDSSSALLQELAAAAEHDIDTRLGDMRDLSLWHEEDYDLIVCMGDSLTHLPELSDVYAVLDAASVSLRVGGALLLSFRDYSQPLATGCSRFIPVRSDDDRVMMCVIEPSGPHLNVTDVVHDRLNDGSWEMRVGTYQKVRIAPDRLVTHLEGVGLTLEERRSERGMILLRFGKNSVYDVGQHSTVSTGEQ